MVLDEIGLLLDDLNIIHCPAVGVLDFQSEHALRFALAPLLARSVALAHSLLRKARVTLEGETPPRPAAAPLQQPIGAIVLHDLAFALRIDVLHMQTHAARTASRSRWGALPNQVQHLVSSLGHLQSLLDGSRAPLERLKGVDASVSSRLAYATLRSGLGESGELESEPGSVQRALLHAGALLSALVTSPGYAYFRTSDRHRAIGLQHRIVNYFDHGASVAVGVQVFKDFRAFVEFLAVINQRQDIKRHDAQRLAQWIFELESNSSATRDLLGSVRQYRDWLYGCDAELDATFDGDVTVSRRGLLNHLRRIEARLGTAYVQGDGLLRAK